MRNRVGPGSTRGVESNSDLSTIGIFDGAKSTLRNQAKSTHTQVKLGHLFHFAFFFFVLLVSFILSSRELHGQMLWPEAVLA